MKKKPPAGPSSQLDALSHALLLAAIGERIGGLEERFRLDFGDLVKREEGVVVGCRHRFQRIVRRPPGADEAVLAAAAPHRAGGAQDCCLAGR